MTLTRHTTTQPTLLVSTEWLAERIGQPAVTLLDVRLPEVYAEGHLPQAVNLPLSDLATFRDGVPEMLIGPARFATLLGQSGVRETDTVVLYDSMWGLPAARALWALERYGHPAVHILDGGIDRWKREGRPLATSSLAPTPTTYRVTPVDEVEATHEWLRARLNAPTPSTGSGQAPSTSSGHRLIVVDTRTPNEYSQGHLPGAVNWDWMNAVPPDNSSALRPADELRAELEALGVTPDKEVVVYCRSGARSAHTYFTLRYLGFPRVRNYDGSWLAWSIKEGRHE